MCQVNKAGLDKALTNAPVYWTWELALRTRVETTSVVSAAVWFEMVDLKADTNVIHSSDE